MTRIPMQFATSRMTRIAIRPGDVTHKRELAGFSTTDELARLLLSLVQAW
jgi:hypothetical protein